MKSQILVLMALAFGAQADELTGGWTFDGAPVTVPHCWNAVDGADGLEVPPGTMGSHSAMVGSYSRGKHTYACSLPAKKSERRYFLECEGASIRAAVRVNGVEIGRHEGAFTGFAFSNVGAVTLSVNGRKVGTQEPDLVKTVFWRNVPLALGMNTIEIAAGRLTRRCTLVRPGCALR